MNPIELADLKLSEYKLRNGEVIAKSCPFCNPHLKDNLYKFYMNQQTGAFKCYRENNCGQTGSFYDLLKHFGLEDKFEFEDDLENDYQKSYKKPEPIKEQPVGKVAEYLDLRCISEETWRSEDIKEKDGNIAFEYYHNDELVLVKYRTANKDKKYWQDGGGKPVLWGIDDIDNDQPVVICEGELDRLAIIEAGYDNVVSVPFGTNNLKWIKECWQELEGVDEFIIWADNDEAGHKMEEEVIKRLGEHRCKRVDVDSNDANLMLYKEGGQAVIEAIESSEGIPIEEFKQLHEVEQFDPSQIPKVKSKIPMVNKYFGGYMEGMVTIWTGTNGSGKSTFLNGEILESVDQDKPISVVSGELPNSMLRYWLELQAAGPDRVKSKYDRVRDEQSYYAGQEDKLKIRDWAKDKLFLYDDYASLAPIDILDKFKRSRMRYNCRNFVVDNLMILDYEGGYRDKYSKQAQFIKDCKRFAKRYDSHVHIVAHPRKNDGIIKKDDIAGLYEVSNLVDNVAGIMRVNDETKKELPEEAHHADNILMLFKSRLYGQENIMIKLMFDEPSKRFFQYGDNNGKSKDYGWVDVNVS